MSKPTVTFEGGDALFSALSGRFKKGMDEQLIGANSFFLKEMDKASVKVFQAMANGAYNHGIRANPVIGTHQNTPSFLVAEGANWEPLSRPYYKRKKRLLDNRSVTTDKRKSVDKDIGLVRTAAFWEYKGQLRRFLASQSKNLTRISNNAILRNAVATPVGEDFLFTDAVKKHNARLKITGGFKNSKPDSFDFVYTPNGDRPITATRTSGARAGELVRSQDISRMTLRIEYNLFAGLQKHVEALMGNGQAPSPEDYIAGIQMIEGKNLTRHQMYKNNKTGQRYFLNGQGEFVPPQMANSNPLAYKLFYKTKGGVIRQRQLIQPYMRYYAKVLNRVARVILTKQG